MHPGLLRVGCPVTVRWHPVSSVIRYTTGFRIKRAVELPPRSFDRFEGLEALWNCYRRTSGSFFSSPRRYELQVIGDVEASPPSTNAQRLESRPESKSNSYSEGYGNRATLLLIHARIAGIDYYSTSWCKGKVMSGRLERQSGGFCGVTWKGKVLQIDVTTGSGAFWGK